MLMTFLANTLKTATQLKKNTWLSIQNTNACSGLASKATLNHGSTSPLTRALAKSLLQTTHTHCNISDTLTKLDLTQRRNSLSFLSSSMSGSFSLLTFLFFHNLFLHFYLSLHLSLSSQLHFMSPLRLFSLSCFPVSKAAGVREDM